MSSMKYISFNMNFPTHLHIRHPKKIIIIKIWIIYFTISLMCQSVLKSLHTLPTYNSQYSSTRHSNRMTYSMFDIIFMYNTSLNQTRTEISIFLMSLHQAPLSSPQQRVHQAFSLARGPGTLPRLLCGAPDTYVLKALSTPDSIPWPRVVCATQSLDKWNIIIFYILNRPPTMIPVCVPDDLIIV